MKVAVVGAGIFGCTVAVDLARAGVTVDLYEQRTGILDGATARCQARLHSGYHYPRSDTTAKQAHDGALEFAARYPDAIARARNHFYVIAPESKTTPEDYLAFCDRNGLPYEVVEKPTQVHTAGLVVRVPEAFVDVAVLRRLLYGDLMRAGVRQVLGCSSHDAADYDVTIWATYGRPWHQPLQYELCEVALLELGRYERDSFVVVDGEFTSLDPLGHVFALYDVNHSVHTRTIANEPDVPEGYEQLLMALGPVRTPLTHFEEMARGASRFLRHMLPSGMGVSIYHGSWFAVRAVLPNVDGTDERPTLIHYGDKSISILSGKICTAVSTAREVVQDLLG